MKMSRPRGTKRDAAVGAAVSAALLLLLLVAGQAWSRHVLRHDGAPLVRDYLYRSALRDRPRGKAPTDVDVLDMDVSTWALLTTRKYGRLPVQVTVRTELDPEPRTLTLHFTRVLGSVQLVELDELKRY